MPLRIHAINPPGKVIVSARPFLVFAISLQLFLELVLACALQDIVHTVSMLFMTCIGIYALLHKIRVEYVVCFGVVAIILFIADAIQLFEFIVHNRPPSYITASSNLIASSLGWMCMWLKPISDVAGILSMVRIIISFSEPHQIIEIHPVRTERQQYGSFIPFQGKACSMDDG